MEQWRQSAPSVHSSYLNYHLSWELELGTGTLHRDGVPARVLGCSELGRDTDGGKGSQYGNELLCCCCLCWAGGWDHCRWRQESGAGMATMNTHIRIIQFTVLLNSDPEKKKLLHPKSIPRSQCYYCTLILIYWLYIDILIFNNFEMFCKKLFEIKP